MHRELTADSLKYCYCALHRYLCNMSKFETSFCLFYSYCIYKHSNVNEIHRFSCVEKRTSTKTKKKEKIILISIMMPFQVNTYKEFFAI